LPPLVFPTGRLLSARWRPVAVVAAAGTVAVITLSAVRPMLQDEDHPVRNPIGRVGVPDPEEGALGAVGFGLLLVCAAAAVTSVVLRFRRSQGVERQRLKWFTYAATLLVLFLLVTDYLLPASGVLEVLDGLVVALVPVAAGVAILRYRLYDIDRLLNRTLVFGALTALLGAVYAAAVLVGGAAVRRGGWQPAELGGGRRDPGGGGPVPAGPAPHPAGGRGPAVQPPQVRRGPDHPGVLHPPARPGRPGHLVSRAARGGGPDHGADPGLAVASTPSARLLGHSPERGGAHSPGLLSTPSRTSANQAVQLSHGKAAPSRMPFGDNEEGD
jgi:hypothetical protein